MAHTRPIAFPVLVFLGAAVLICLLACSKDSPNGPCAVEPEYAYFYDFGNVPGYRQVNLYSGGVDSFSLSYVPFSVERLTLSYDNSLLLIPLLSELIVVSTENLEVLQVLPIESWAGIAITRDNRYVAASGFGTVIYDRVGDSTVFFDTTLTADGYFSHDGTLLVCRTNSHPSPDITDLYTVDMSTLSSSRREFGSSPVRIAQPSLNERDIYLCIQGPYRSTFAIYQRDTDSIAYTFDYTPHLGDICQTPDGRYVLISSSGDGTRPPYGLGRIYVYDVSAGLVDDTITTLQMQVDGTSMNIFDVGNMFMGSTGDRLFISPAGPDTRYAVLALPSREPQLLQLLPGTTVGLPCRYGSL